MKKHLLLIALGGLLAPLVTYYLTYDLYVIAFSTYALLGALGIGMVYIILALTLWLDLKLPWKTNTGSRLLAGWLLYAIITFGLTYLAYWGYYQVVFSGGTAAFANEEIFIKLAILLFILSLFYSVVYFALYSYHEYAWGQIERIRLEREQIDLQLKALKTQLSPHFLFNSLNTISALLFNDLAKAETFVRRLAASYRYTLRSYDKRLVSLQEELSFVRSYQFLLETRFGEQLKIAIAIDEEELNTKVPPLTIQMLVENAVKHNRLDDVQPLRINIDCDKNWINVSNNKTKRPEKVNSLGIGLQNIQERYRLLSQREIIVQDELFFTIKLPLIR